MNNVPVESRLVHALRLMLSLHGEPKREAYATEAAYKYAVRIHEVAQSVIKEATK